jgi:hypothetical protein
MLVTRTRPARPGTASGLVTDSSCPSSRSGWPSRKTIGTAAVTIAHQRQRGEGSDPVGVSSKIKPTKAGQTIPGVASL